MKKMLKPLTQMTNISKVVLWLGVWHGVYFFLKKPMRLLWLVFTLPFLIGFLSFLIEVYVAYSQDEVMSASEGAGVQTLPPPLVTEGNADDKKAPALPAQDQFKNIMKASSNVKTLPPFVGKVEDGSSVFNVSLAQKMQGNDYQFYASHFRYAMSYFPADTNYKWMINPTFYGYFKAEEAFKAPSGVMCRKFEEVTSYNKINQRFKGYACQRGDGGWCKLRGTSSLTCGVANSSPNSIFWRNTVNGLFMGW